CSTAGPAAAASVVTPFVSAPQTTSPDGQDQQNNAVAQAAAAPASQAATVVQNAIAAAPSTTTQTSAATTSGTTATSALATPTFTGPFAWIYEIIYNTYNNFPSGAWGIGLSQGNLNSMRQILQAYFAVGLGNFGYGIGQQLITPAQATALEKGLGFTIPAAKPPIIAPIGGTAGVSGAPFTTSSVSA